MGRCCLGLDFFRIFHLRHSLAEQWAQGPYLVSNQLMTLFGLCVTDYPKYWCFVQKYFNVVVLCNNGPNVWCDVQFPHGPLKARPRYLLFSMKPRPGMPIVRSGMLRQPN